MVKNKLDCFGSILFKIIELGRFKINKKKKYMCWNDIF